MSQRLSADEWAERQAMHAYTDKLREALDRQGQNTATVRWTIGAKCAVLAALQDGLHFGGDDDGTQAEWGAVKFENIKGDGTSAALVDRGGVVLEVVAV